MALAWSFGRLKRIIPWIFALFSLWILWKKFSQHEVNDSLMTPTTTPMLPAIPPSEPPGPNQWVVSLIPNDVCPILATTFKQWNILLVGVQPLSQFGHSRCHYFKDTKNEADIVKLSNKAMALLHVIKLGADVIYILEADIHVDALEAPKHVYTDSTHRGLVSTSPNGFLDPNCHWGCNASNSQCTSETEPVYHMCTHTTPALQTEAITGPFKDLATESKSLEEPWIPCDSSAPSVTLTPQTFTHIRLDKAVYLHAAFWAIPVVNFKSKEEESIWSFIIQRTLWSLGHQVLVHYGKSKMPQGNISNVLSDLPKSNCSSLHPLDCFSQDIKSLVSQGKLPNGTDLITRVWLDSMERVQYNPTLRNISDRCSKEPIIYKPVRHRVTYKVQKWRPTPFLPIENLQSIFSLHRAVCQNYLQERNSVDFTGPWFQFDDLLLVVVFNNPHYESIPYIEVMYRSFFPRMLYCGPGFPSHDKHPELKSFKYSFISYIGTPAGHFNGSLNYECVITAINMHFDVKGILVIADDLLLFTHRLKKLDKGLVWYMPQKDIRIADMLTLHECQLGMCDFYPRWRYWEEYRSAIMEVFKIFKREKDSNLGIYQCYKELLRANGGDFRPNGAYSDIYYIPTAISLDFANMAQMFLDNYVFLEIAVPTALRCVFPAEEVQSLRGTILWDQLRDDSWMHFNKKEMVNKAFIHPTKWSYLVKGSEDFRRFFCKAMIYQHDGYGMLSNLN